MSDKDVNIRVNQQSTGSALTDAERQAAALTARIEALKVKMAEMNRLEKSYSEQGLPQAAASVRSERIPQARELRDALREQRESQRSADREGTAAAKQRAAEERSATQAAKERDAIEKARGHALRVGASIVGGGALALGGTVLEDYFARQQIGIQDQVARARFSRGLGLHSERGITAGAATSELWSNEDAQFEAAQRQKGLESARAGSIWKNALYGAGAGAASGAALGSVVPGLGTLAGGIGGALVGGGAGAFRGYLSGNRDLAGNANEQKRLREQHEQLVAQQRARVAAEVLPEVEAQEKLNRGEAQGARILQDQVSWLQRRRALKHEGATDAEAERGADAAIAQIQKERAGNFARLVTARTGAGESARIAGLAAQQIQTGSRDSETGRLIDVVERNHAEASGAASRKNFQRPPLL